MTALVSLERFRAAARAHGFRVPDGRSEWRMPCPGHQGKNDNLAVAAGDRGVLLTCHSRGCDAKTIASALGLSPSDLFEAEPSPHPSKEAPWRTVAVYPYEDESGRPCFEVVRQERGERLPGVKPEKRFLQRHIGADGRPAWGLNGTRRVLFRLPRLLEAIAEERAVLVVEGEKCVLAAERLGLPATTAPQGAGSWVRAGADPHGYAESLRGAHVVLLPDNDKPGREHMRAVGKLLSAVAASVRVLELPDLPAKGDLADWLDGGGTPEALASLLDEARPFPVWLDGPESPAEAEAEADDAFPRPKRLADVSGDVHITWSVDDLLIAGEPAWIGAVDGAFKSTVALHIGCAVAGGYAVAGHFQARQGPVLIVSGEDPEEIIRNRAEAICRGQGWNVSATLGHMHVLALEGTDLRDAGWQAHLLRLATELKPSLIIFDPYADMIVGDENSNSDAQVVKRTLRALTRPSGATVLVLHHFKKAVEGASKSDLFRGASAPVRASRQTYVIEKSDTDNLITLQCIKFSRAGFRGTARERFALRFTITTDDENEAVWRAARFDFVSSEQARFDGAEQFVLQALADGARLSTTDLKDCAKGTGISGADISRVLKSLSFRKLIDFEPGERGAKLWGLPNATLPSDLGKVGKVGNDLARQGATLPGNLFSEPSTLPAPFRGQGGKVEGSVARQAVTEAHA